MIPFQTPFHERVTTFNNAEPNPFGALPQVQVQMRSETSRIKELTLFFLFINFFMVATTIDDIYNMKCLKITEETVYLDVGVLGLNCMKFTINQPSCTF